MRIIILLLIVGVFFVSAKYIPQERDDSQLLLRTKRSVSDESVGSIDRDSEESSNSDSDDGDIAHENKRLEEQIKLREEEKLQKKQIEKLEKERRKNDEQQRKVQEKLAKEARKEQEKKEKEERRRQEREEKEKRKQEENERKAAKKVRKEQLKRQQTQNKELDNLQKEILEQSDEDDFLETEEESSVELEDIWRSYIYQKYGLSIASTKLEKQAALNKYLQDELGLNPNSTVSERRQVIVKLIQAKLESDLALRESLRNQILSHINAVAIQKLRTKLENDIEELDNKTELINNVSLPWATQAHQNITDKKSLLQTVVQFLSSLLPTWVTGEQPSNLSPESNISSSIYKNTNDLSSPESKVPENKLLVTDDNLRTENSGITKIITSPNTSNDNKIGTDENTGLVASISVTEASSISDLQTSEKSDLFAIPKNDINGIPPIITEPETINGNGYVNILIGTDNMTNQNTGSSESDKISLVNLTISSDIAKSPETKNDVSLLLETNNISEKTITTNLIPEQNTNDWGQNDVNILNSIGEKDPQTVITDTETNNISNKRNVPELNSDTTSTSDNANLNTDEAFISSSSDSPINVLDTSVNNNVEGNIIQNSTISSVEAGSDLMSINAVNSVDNPSVNNNIEGNVIQNKAGSPVSLNNNLQPVDSKTSIDITSINNNLEGDNIQNATENAASVNNDFFPIDPENLIPNVVESNDIKNNVTIEDNVILAESSLPVTDIAISDLTEITNTTENSAVDSLVTSENINNNAIKNDVNQVNSITTDTILATIDSNNIGSFPIESLDSIISISKTENSGDNTASPSSVIDLDITNSISNNKEKKVINAENVITTESSGSVVTNSPNSDISTTSGLNILNTELVTLTENIEIAVLSTSSPVDVGTNGNEPTTNEVTISSIGDEVLSNNNLSTTLSDNTKILSPLDAVQIPDIAIVSNDNAIDTNATIVITDVDSATGSNASEIVEIFVTPVAEAFQPNTMLMDLLTTKIDITTEQTVNDPSSTPVYEDNGDTTNTAIATEINPIDSVTIPLETGAAVVEITSQT